MAESLATLCENIVKEINVDIAVYDGNGNAQYLTGASELTNGDVSAIRNVLQTNNQLPFTLGLSDSNYFCLKSSDGILCAKGGFNCKSEYKRIIRKQKTPKQDIEKLHYGEKEPANDISSSNNDRKTSSSDQDNNNKVSVNARDERKLVQGFVNKGFVQNEPDDVECSKGNVKVKNDINIHVRSHDVNKAQESKNVNNNNVLNDNTTAAKEVRDGMKTHKELGSKTLLSKSSFKQKSVSDGLLALTIHGYTVILRGFQDCDNSWLKMLQPQLNQAFASLNHEE